MSRFCAIVLCSLAAVVASATPAPQPKPWVKGWDRPLDSRGDCRFEREGARLTITLPGEGPRLEERKKIDPDTIWVEGTTVAQLLRDVEGDFAMEARVRGDSWSGGLRRAGILMRGAEEDPTLTLEFQGQPEGGSWLVRSEVHRAERISERVRRHDPAYPAMKSLYLRVERRGDRWRMSYSTDRKDWLPVAVPEGGELPRKLKLGVFAAARVENPFKVTFAKFKLIPLKK
jgi:regulation of enolase protein 1 (concanavalin A-like superfamily)